MSGQLLTCVLALSLFGVPVSATDLFLHIDVESDDDGLVQVNLPLAVLELGVAMMPRPFHVEDRITIGSLRISRSNLEDLREVLEDLESGELANLRFGWRRVSVSASDGFVVLHSPARGWWDEEVEIRASAGVLDAFLGDGDGLDLMSGFRALGDHPESVILVEDDDGRSTARIWVDGHKEISR